MSRPPELTVDEAAAVLNVSEESLSWLLDTGEIVSRRERYVLTSSLLAYKHADDARRRAALDALPAETDKFACKARQSRREKG